MQEDINNDVEEKKEIKTLFMGETGGGKTLLLYRLKIGKILSTIPTLGFNFETIENRYGKYFIINNIWEVGGLPRIIETWKHYFEKTDLLVYFINLAEDESIIRSKKIFWDTIAKDEKLLSTKFLFVGNKLDLVGSCKYSQEDFRKLFSLENIAQKWEYLEMSGLNDDVSSLKEFEIKMIQMVI